VVQLTSSLIYAIALDKRAVALASKTHRKTKVLVFLTTTL